MDKNGYIFKINAKLPIWSIDGSGIMVGDRRRYNQINETLKEAGANIRLGPPIQDGQLLPVERGETMCVTYLVGIYTKSAKEGMTLEQALEMVPYDRWND